MSDLNVPIPAVSTKASDKTEREPQRNSIFTQSSFPIGIAIFIQFVHRQIDVLLHPLPDDKPDRVVARHAQLAGQVAEDFFHITRCATAEQPGAACCRSGREIRDPVRVFEERGGVRS